MSINIAIVVQGQICECTAQVLDFYNNFNCTLILSTYTNSVHFNTSKLNNFHLVMQDPPPHFNHGFGNRNIQRFSSFNGVQLAQNLGCQYILKCRTDHFFKNPNLINILMLSLRSFPLTINQGQQQERIIVGNGGTTLSKQWYFPHISDFWLFGHIKDIYAWFSIHNPYWDCRKIRNSDNRTATEVEFCRLWMQHMNIPAPHTTSELLKDRFIVLDNDSLFYDIVKGAGANDTYNRMNTWELGGVNCDPLTVRSRRWFQFYQGMIYTPEQEDRLTTTKKYF